MKSIRCNEPRQRASLAVNLVLSLVLIACATGGPVLVTSEPSTTQPAAGGGSAAPSAAVASTTTSHGYRVTAREHVDLWLHGFALLQADSSLVPYFRLDYRRRVEDAKRRSGTRTQLDERAPDLTPQLSSYPSLTSAQFLPLYFVTWEEMLRGIQLFLRDGGDVRRAPNREMVRMYATLATYYPGAVEREWLRSFSAALDDERRRFFSSWWRAEQANRRPVFVAIASHWNGPYGVGISRFLRAGNQPEGMILLSMPLAGEGRTLSVSRTDNFLTVGFPSSGEDPLEALYVIAHESVGAAANLAVQDHTTPNDAQTGVTARWQSLAAVVGGSELLARVAPDIVEGYRRYYLRLARVTPTGDTAKQFADIFALPPNLVAAVGQQIDNILGGI